MSLPKANKGGQGRTANIMTPQSGGSWPSIKIPELTCWGASEYKDPKDPDADGKWSIDFQMPSADYPSPEGDLLLNKMVEFDQQIVKLISQMSESIYPKFRSEESISDIFTGSLKYPKDKVNKAKLDYTKAPTVKGKIKVYPNAEGVQEWKLTVYDNQKRLVFPPEAVLKAGQTPEIDNETGEYVGIQTHIPKLSRVVGLIQPKVWFTDKTCGVSWTIQQIKVVKTKSDNSLTDCQFDDDEDEQQYEEEVVEKPVDKPAEKPVDTPVAVDKPVVTPMAEAVVDEDEDEAAAEESSDDLPEPPAPSPPPVVAKKPLKPAAGKAKLVKK